MPDAASGCPVAHLNAGHRRRGAAEDRAQCGSFGRVGLRRAVAVRDDHADLGRRNACIVERSADRARRALAVLAEREQPHGFGRVAAAQILAEDLRVARAR